MLRIISCTLLILVCFAPNVRAQEATDDTKAPAVDKATAAKYEKFSKLLTGAKMVGKFTIVGRDMDPPAEEYELLKVEKLPEGDYWRFDARVKYGGKDIQMPPLRLKVKWAGDTPMITLTNLTIPGVGTFSSRVMFYNGKYAGTWTHGEVHGHMFGVIKKPDAAE